MKHATFRFYADLNDFLPPHARGKPLSYAFYGQPSVKDAIEAQSVPHGEVELVIADGTSVPLDWHLADGARVAVYPKFRSLHLGPEARIHRPRLQPARFVLDGHLGKLARQLRMLGFDALWSAHADDAWLAQVCSREGRALLSRDLGLLKRKRVTHAYWVRATQPRLQLREVVDRFDLGPDIAPFTRCMACNTLLEPASEEAAHREVPPSVARRHTDFRHCPGCGRLYWAGSHHARMVEAIDALRRPARTP